MKKEMEKINQTVENEHRTKQFDIDEALQHWGQFIQDISSSKPSTTLDRNRLFRSITHRYSTWKIVFATLSTVTTVLFVLALGISFFTSSEPSIPSSKNTVKGLYSFSGPFLHSMSLPSRKKDDALQLSLQLILSQVQQEHKPCPNDPSKIDFSDVSKSIRDLYIKWTLEREGRVRSQSFEILRDLYHTVNSCMTADQAEQLKKWASEKSQSLYLQRPVR